MSNSSNVHVASPVHKGQVKCYAHGVVLQRRVSHTEANPDRAFYSCELPNGPDGETCQFFKWEDRLGLSPTPTPSPSSPSKRPASTTEHEHSPVRKRLAMDASAPSPGRTAASQARLAAMMSAQGLLPHAEASTSAAPRSPSPSPSTHTSQPSPHLPSWFSAQPASTGLYPPMTPPRTSTSTSKESQDSERRGTERHLDWLPQTPPASRALGPAAPSEHPSGTRDENSHEPRNGNGMQNRYLNLANASASLEAAPGPLCSPSGSATSSGGSEPRGPEVELSPIEQFMDTSNRTKDYMLMLERRLSAAEKSNDAKAERMERLLEEIDILKARNADLERRLAS